MSSMCLTCQSRGDGDLCSDVCPGWPPPEAENSLGTISYPTQDSVNLGVRGHVGDPCIYCGTPHDNVSIGDCPGR